MEPPDPPLLDFAAALGRLRRLGPVLVVLAFAGAVVEGAGAGFSAGLLVRWMTVLAVLVLATMAVLTAVHALGGADRAQRRGERLSGDDVGFLPARRTEDSNEHR